MFFRLTGWVLVATLDSDTKAVLSLKWSRDDHPPIAETPAAALDEAAPKRRRARRLLQ